MTARLCYTWFHGADTQAQSLCVKSWLVICATRNSLPQIKANDFMPKLGSAQPLAEV